MVLDLITLKEICSTVLTAVDSNELSILTETLELRTNNKVLYFNVTNREYYAQFKIPILDIEDFHATVNANLFLNLINKTTSNEVELIVKDNMLIVKGNGTYKLPLIYEDDNLLELPKIIINNITSEFDVDGNILISILNYNSKQLGIGTISKPVQKMYYLDEQGALTFTSGACVNNFTLEKPIKILLNNRLVKLFKVFKNKKVHFTLGYDAISDEIIQTKVCFESDTASITAILSCDESMINSVPVKAIRDRATSNYDYSVVINRFSLIQSIDRLLLFTVGYGSKEILKPYGQFKFSNASVTISDMEGGNEETINYSNEVNNLDESYVASFDLVELKTILDSFNNEYITLCFGDHQAAIIHRDNVYNVIPECISVD